MIKLETFAEMIHLDFQCDHINYARWGCVNLTEILICCLCCSLGQIPIYKFVLLSPTINMASSPNSSTSPLLVDDNMDYTNDPLHLDGEGNIKSAQPSSPVMLQITPEICLTSENFKIVCEQWDSVCSLISTRESICSFSDTNLCIYGQNIRPHWLGQPIRHKSSTLIGSISLPTDFHNVSAKSCAEIWIKVA